MKRTEGSWFLTDFLLNLHVLFVVLVSPHRLTWFCLKNCGWSVIVGGFSPALLLSSVIRILFGFNWLNWSTSMNLCWNSGYGIMTGQLNRLGEKFFFFFFSESRRWSKGYPGFNPWIWCQSKFYYHFSGLVD